MDDLATETNDEELERLRDELQTLKARFFERGRTLPVAT